MAPSSTVTSLPPLNLFTLLIYTKSGGTEVLQVRYGVYSGVAGTGKEEMKCFSVVNNIFSLLTSFMLFLILQASKTLSHALTSLQYLHHQHLYFLCGFVLNLLAVWGFCLLISGVGLQFLFYIFFCINVSLLCISQIEVDVLCGCC